MLPIVTLSPSEIASIKAAIAQTRPQSPITRICSVTPHKQTLFVVFQDDVDGETYTRVAMLPTDENPVNPPVIDLVVKPCNCLTNSHS